MPDVNQTSKARKTESLDPELVTPPEAKKISGSESGNSVPGSRRKTRKGINGSKRLVCKRCGHFLAELKAVEFEALLLCHRCKTENTFAYQEL